MPKRKRYPKLPNGWGSIRYLGKRRRNPYAVHPPATERRENGEYVRPPAICYVRSWLCGFAVLNAYRAGTYRPGDEVAFQASLDAGGEEGADSYVSRIIADSNKAVRTEEAKKKPTFAEVYEAWFEWKTGENAAKPPSKATVRKYKTTYALWKEIHDRPMEDITVDELQAVINACQLGEASRSNMISLISLVSKYAEQRGIVEKSLSRYLVIPASAAPNEHGVPFTEEEIGVLWEAREDPDCEMVLIMCYTGHRASEYAKATVDLEAGAIFGGSKTEAGRNRVVPIHPAILPMVRRRVEERGEHLFFPTYKVMRAHFKRGLKKAGLEGHTCHDARHTFSTLCERYGVSDNDRKRMMGHSFGSDVTNSVYGHRTVADLAEQVRKIPAPADFVAKSQPGM